MLGNQRQRTIMTYIARAGPIPANKEIGHQTDRDLQNEGAAPQREKLEAG